MTRRRIGRVAGAAAAITGLALAAAAFSPATVGTTSAAWTDPVQARAVVSAGSWTPATPPASPIPSDVITAATSATMLGGITWSITAPNDGATCADVTVTTASATPVAWALTVRVAASPFYGGSLWSGDGVVSGSGATRTVTGHGGNDTVVSGTSRVIRVCVSPSGLPTVGDPSWYSVTVSHGDWSDTRACLVVTATGSVTASPASAAYFGWRASVDFSVAKNRITSAGKTLNPGYVEWSGGTGGTDPYFYTYSPTGQGSAPATFTITSGRSTSIHGTSSASVTVCAIGY